MTHNPYTGPREALWDGSDLGWVLVNVRPNAADIAARYLAVHPGRNEVALFGSQRQARETFKNMLAAGVPAVPTATCQEEREWAKVEMRQSSIQSRWGNLLLMVLVIFSVTTHMARFESLGRVFFVGFAGLVIILTFHSWWLWWRSVCPSGCLGYRVWSKASQEPEMEAATEDEHTWPPPPRQGRI